MNSPSPVSLTDTIVAVATPLGEGGLGVVRLSGPHSFDIADQIFQTQHPLTQVPSHTLHHGWIVDQKIKLDEAVAAIFRGPASYTGENICELSCHGSPAVLRSVVSLCVSRGARPAKPGEFTERAFLNGKMDLIQAEAVADLIRAGSSKAQRAATEQLRGGLSQRLEEIRAPLIDLLAHLEANLDFVEEDIPPLSARSAQDQLKTIVQKLDQLLATATTGRQLREGLRVALVGKPNVGKSSLFNALLRSDRAIVTDVPGTTRDTIEEKTQWSGMPVVLTDTAGLREDGDTVERFGQERAQQAIARADLLILVIDGSMPINADDREIIRNLNGKPAVIAVNKSDLKAVLKDADLKEFDRYSSVAVSAKTESGLSDLQTKALDRLGVPPSEAEDAGVAVSERHRAHLEETRTRLNAALHALETRRSEESVGWDLREAVRALDRITGADVNADLLEAVFRKFCIGK